MSTSYRRDFPEFKARLATRQAVRRLTMTRLADAFRESLTDEQRQNVVKALESGNGEHISDLSISARNALFCLLSCNEVADLTNYLVQR
jgi:hypothetical protein